MSADVRGPVVPGPGRARLTPLGLESVTITGGPWARWQRDLRAVSIPHALGWLEREGSVDNLRRLDPAAVEPPPRRGLLFTDSDLYKVLEGIGWALGSEPSDELTARLTAYADVLARAQQPDGYLNSFVQTGLAERWTGLQHSHEHYCLGHLVQAAVAERRSTGGTALLDVAVRAADLLVAEFGEGRRTDLDGHEEVEMALVELSRLTGRADYLQLARQFVDLRGRGRLTGGLGADYHQDAVPVREQTTVVGHAVRALYLLAGMVDVAVETGEQALLAAAVRQWDSMTATRTYLTGALGSRFEGEAFGDAYELPPDLGYGETCATIANLMVCWRLLLATGEARFADAMERALHNVVAASTNLTRDGYFYSNPLQRRTPRPAAPADQRSERAEAPGTRPPWFACACCPPNVIRTVAALGGYLASHTGDRLQLHQFVPAGIAAPLAGGGVRLDVVTDYPVDGAVVVHVRQTGPAPWTLELRVPAWAGAVELRVNGDEVASAVGPRGYLEVARAWRVDDRVELRLPLEPRLTVPHPSVDALRGTVAVERGPVVYALESPDQDRGVDLDAVELVSGAPLREDRRDLLGDRVPVVVADGVLRTPATAPLWAPLGATEPAPVTPVTLTFVPYALWANRGPSTMRVHVPHRTAVGTTGRAEETP